MKKAIVLFAAIAVLSLTALADIPPYRPTPKPTPQRAEKSTRMEMNIRVDRNRPETTLIIPKSLVKDPRAALDGIENGNQNTAAIGGFNAASTQTIMGGLFMSLAVVVGGIFLFRTKPSGKTIKAAGALIMAAMFGASAAVMIYANTPPPPYKGIDASIFSEKIQNRYMGTIGEVKVKLDERDYSGSGQILLLVGKSESVEKTDE